MSKKIIYDASKFFEFKDSENNLKAAYFPEIKTDDISDDLLKMDFTRVHYISRFGKANRTPRLTWCYGKMREPHSTEHFQFGKIRDSEIETVEYKGLNFIPEVMPIWLEN